MMKVDSAEKQALAERILGTSYLLDYGRFVAFKSIKTHHLRN